MAKARKEGSSKGNRANLVKRLKVMEKNRELIKQYENK